MVESFAEAAARQANYESMKNRLDRSLDRADARFERQREQGSNLSDYDDR